MEDVVTQPYDKITPEMQQRYYEASPYNLVRIIPVSYTHLDVYKRQAVDKVNARMTALHSDEDRQRANITALANADKASRERFVRDLNATEDKIAAAQKDLTAAQKNLQAAKDDLANKIESLQIDEKL